MGVFELGFCGLQVTDPPPFPLFNDRWIELARAEFLLQQSILTTWIAAFDTYARYPLALEMYLISTLWISDNLSQSTLGLT
jgi:hypothetical protein